MDVSEVILNQVAQGLNGLSEGDAGKMAEQFAAHYGVTKQTVFRWAAVKGLRWRKQRSDKGSSGISEEVLQQTGALLYASRRKSNEIPLPTCDAVEMLQDSGVDISISNSRVCTLLRQSEISIKDLVRPAPHQTLLSNHPNHVWQFDVTNCLQYFLDDKGMGERDSDMELYKNKIVKIAKTIKKELLRYVAVDHCTGAFFFWYYYASGERAIDGADFLYRAMRPKDELIKAVFNGKSASMIGKYHFHGVPFLLIPDRGSIIVDKANQSLFRGLVIDVRPHMPGNPRAKGAVEGMMHHINRFEARLKFKRPRDLAQLNEWALDWTIMINGVKEMRGIAPRSALWSTIKKEQLRLCPEEKVYKWLIRRPEIERTCDGSMWISLDNRDYRVPDPAAANHKVKIVINPYEHPAVEVHFNAQVWLLQPIERDQYGRRAEGATYGEYKGIKHTVTQRAKTEMEKLASEEWGLKWKGTGDKRIAIAPPIGHESPLQVFGHQADKVPVEFINRPGHEFEIRPPEMPENREIRSDAAQISRSIVTRKISFMEFLKSLKNEIGNIPSALNQELRNHYADGIEITQAEEVIIQVKAGTWPPAVENGAQDAVAVNI